MNALKIILGLLSGLSLFLFGMSIMGDALEKSAGNRLKSILGKMTANPLSGFLLGAGVTAVIQSSSATTVMLVGFVNAGLMSLGATIPVIMGANVGTTVTAWILSLTGIEGGAWYLDIFKPSSFTPVLAVIGVILFVFMKGGKKKDIGLILLGFAVLIFGMDSMSAAIKPLAEEAWFRNLFVLFENPLLGLLVGALVTAIIQSSSASVGILQALAAELNIAAAAAGLPPAFTVGMAFPIIMGQNIGTCVTAAIGSAGASKDAKRVAAVHLSFNIIGSTFILSLFCLLEYLILPDGIPFAKLAADQSTIAIVHTVFNVSCSILLLPCYKLLEKLAMVIIKDSNEKENRKIIFDQRLLATPSIAIEQAKLVTNKMALISQRSLKNALSLLENYDKKLFASIKADEDEVDEYEDELGTYLIKITGCELSNEDSLEVSKLLHMIGDLERLSDHAVNLGESAEEMSEKRISFSKEAKAELKVMSTAVSEILDTAIASFTENSLDLASDVEPLEEVIDLLQSEIRANHITRLKNSECTIELGFILGDLLSNLERVSDHCSNIAGCVIEIAHSSLGMHGYSRSIKSGNKRYDATFKKFSDKYRIAI